MLSMEELSSLPTWTTANHSSPKSCPVALRQYITTCERLSIGREPDGRFAQSEANVWKENTRGMSPKKLHEVSRMAWYVNAVCKETNCGTVVDVGSGLGYLGQCLSSQYNLRVVGLEREEERVGSASRRSRKIVEYHSPMKASEILERGHLCVDDFGPKMVKGGTSFEDLHANLKQMDSLIGTHSPEVKDHPIACNEVCFDFKTDQDCLQGYCHSNGPHLEDAFVTLPLSINDSEASLRHFQTVLEEVISKDNDRVCLTGLHCCGDLTPTIMRWCALRNTPGIKAVVLVGCCYHKMAATEGQEGKFKNFPTSQFVTEHVTKNGLSVSKYALRLAAQETKRRWLTQSAADHMSHMKRVAYRAILEVGLHRVSVNVPLTKVTRVKESSLYSFSVYLDEILKELDLSKCQTDSLSVKEILMKTYEELSPHMHIVEAFTALQVCLQGPLESLVLLDRLLFMTECGVPMETLEQDNTTHAHAKLVPLFDDYVSPRSIALVMM